MKIIQQLSLVGALFFGGCASLPELVSKDSFSGRVLEIDSNKPIQGVLIYGVVYSQQISWDNSGAIANKIIICKDYSISDQNGNFTFPSLTGISGPSIYRFGVNRSTPSATYEILGIGYREAGYYAKLSDYNVFQVRKCKLSPSMLRFKNYLEGDRALNFRKDDYKSLLILLDKWHEVTLENSYHTRYPEEESLYQKFKAIFSNENK